MTDLLEKQRKARNSEVESADGVLLELLLNAKDADTGDSLPDEDIKDELMTFFFAGFRNFPMNFLIDLRI